MWRQIPFRATGGWTFDQILKRFFPGEPPKTSSAPFSQVFSNGLFGEWFSEETPGLPAGPRHNRHLPKLLLSTFGAISATQSRYQANYLSALFKSSGQQRTKGLS